MGFECRCLRVGVDVVSLGNHFPAGQSRINMQYQMVMVPKPGHADRLDKIVIHQLAEELESERPT